MVAVNLSPARVPVPRTTGEHKDNSGTSHLPLHVTDEEIMQGEKGMRGLPKKHGGNRYKRI